MRQPCFLFTREISKFGSKPIYTVQTGAPVPTSVQVSLSVSHILPLSYDFLMLGINSYLFYSNLVILIIKMEVDASKAKWLLDRAYNAQNIFEARSWLLTARNTHPTLFSVQYAAYELGKYEKT